MGFINIFVSKQSKLSIKNKQLHVENEDGDNVFVTSDINCVLVENVHSTISSYTMQYLAQNKVAVFFCDEKHLPCAVCIPFDGYYSPLSVLNLQSEVGKPLKKRLWQSIVKCKIEGQAKTLKLLGKDGWQQMFDYSKSVLSDDGGNIEATSAAFYFKRYLDDGSRRKDDTFVNACLDYGYAIVRGLIARTLAVYGFEMCLGLHHCSELNRFNLADDLIEPFRPYVDLWIATYIDGDEMNSDVKRNIFAIVNGEMIVDGQHHTLTYAIELLVQSLKKSLVDEANKLKLPTFEDAVIHKYV